MSTTLSYQETTRAYICETYADLDSLERRMKSEGYWRHSLSRRENGDLQAVFYKITGEEC